MIATVPLQTLPGINPNQSRVYCHAAIGAHRIERRDVDLGRYSRRCTYHKYEYHYTYNSWAHVRRGGRTLVYCGHDGETFTHRAPAGWRWGIDDNGVRLYRVANPSIDFHPYGEHLRRHSGDAGDYCREAAIRNWRHRQEQLRRERQYAAERLARDAARRAVIERAIYLGVDVTLSDSRAAGNCEAGTLAWAQRHGIDRRDVPAAEIAEYAGDERVYQSIRIALERTERELDDETIVLTADESADLALAVA